MAVTRARPAVTVKPLAICADSPADVMVTVRVPRVAKDAIEMLAVALVALDTRS